MLRGVVTGCSETASQLAGINHCNACATVLGLFSVAAHYRSTSRRSGSLNLKIFKDSDWSERKYYSDTGNIIICYEFTVKLHGESFEDS